MVLDIQSTIHRLIIVALLLTPVFTAGEVYALLSGLVYSQTVSYTPTYVKLVKDVLLVVLAVLAAGGILSARRVHRLAVPVVILGLYVLAAAVMASTVDLRLVVAGLRWSFPVFLAFLLIRYVDEALLTRIAWILGGMLLVQFALQLVQLFTMSRWFGSAWGGLAARVPGLFFIPSTAGFFALVTLFFAICYLDVRWLRRSIMVVAPLSVFLTQSGTAIVVLLVLAILWILGVRRALLGLPLAPVLLAGFLLLLPWMTGRGTESMQLSGSTRVGILRDLLYKGEWFPTAFGHATNTAVGFAANLDAEGRLAGSSMIVDSTYGSVIGNLGLIGLAILAGLMLLWALFLLNNKRMDLYAFTLIYSLFGFTLIITEAYPMNLLFAVLIAYFVKNTRAEGAMAFRRRANEYALNLE